MTLKFTQTSFIGSRTYAVGETADLPDEQATRAIADGTAVLVKPTQPKGKGRGKTVIETATDPITPIETADIDTAPSTND